jgi:hypothetical protein
MHMRDIMMVMDTTIGRPADILDDLTARQIGIVAACMFPRTEGRIAHLTVKDADESAVRSIAAEHGALVMDVRDVLVVDPAEYGGAAAVARRVADAGAVVYVAYFGAEGEIVLGTSDMIIASRALGLAAPDAVNAETDAQTST